MRKIMIILYFFNDMQFVLTKCMHIFNWFFISLSAPSDALRDFEGFTHHGLEIICVYADGIFHSNGVN